MIPPKAERERVERELAESTANVRAIRAAVDYLVSGLDSPNPMTQVRCASAILRETNKARERELTRRIHALESAQDEARGTVRLKPI